MKNNFLSLLFILYLLVNTIPLDAQWIQVKAPNGSSVRTIAISGTNLFVGTLGSGVFISTNNGTNWSPVNSGLTPIKVPSLAVSGANLFAGTTNGGVFLSTNNGVSWTAVNSGLTDTIIWSLAAFGANLFVGTASGVFRSTNSGTNWSTAGLTNILVNTFAISDTNLFAGSRAVYISTNNGQSWKAVGMTNGDNLAFATFGKNLFVAGAGVYLSTNNGVSWTAAGLTDKSVNALAVSGNSLFAGTFGEGVYLSTNNGSSWTAVNAGLPNAYVRALAVYGTNLFAGTDSDGVWRRPLSEMTTVQNASTAEIPKEFSLAQNYPNPFNPATSISFALPFKSFVVLKIFNALGKEVSILLADELPEGTYTRYWNAADLPSGLYFYRLQAGSFTETKKLLLLK